LFSGAVYRITTLCITCNLILMGFVIEYNKSNDQTFYNLEF
jgi:hypothetical protein